MNDQFQIATTCLQRPPFWGAVFNLYSITDLRTATTCLQRPLFRGPKGGHCTQVWLYFKCRIFIFSRFTREKHTHFYSFINYHSMHSQSNQMLFGNSSAIWINPLFLSFFPIWISLISLLRMSCQSNRYGDPTLRKIRKREIRTSPIFQQIDDSIMPFKICTR